MDKKRKITECSHKNVDQHKNEKNKNFDFKVYFWGVLGLAVFDILVIIVKGVYPRLLSSKFVPVLDHRTSQH